MQRLSVAERREIAVQLGHGLVKIEPSTPVSSRFAIICSCGWGARLADGRATVTCATEREAASRAVHHVKTAVDRYLVSRERDGASPFGYDRVSARAG